MAQAAVDTIAERLDKLYEFEREPVTPDKLHDGRYFAGMFAGEHVAGTEFVIGALFVQWGATAGDLIWGLLIGNLLAVLSWAFICAPIAVRTRLTLYWYARQIIGPGLTVVYNIINALLYCFLAAAMIGVSASAVGLAVQKLGLPFVHPSLDDVLPNGVAWVVIVLFVGAVVVLLAIAGFKKLSRFAGVCAPWMFMIFVAGAIATLPGLGTINTARDFWHVVETEVWNGEPLVAKQALADDTAIRAALNGGAVPQELRRLLLAEMKPKKRIDLAADASVTVAKPDLLWRIRSGEDTYVIGHHDYELRVSQVASRRLGFWHILFFAWFCNLAMHIGLSDMAVFRYARKWQYGFYSAFGMYLGHYAAWVCAGIMGAVIWGEVNPGRMADVAAGMAGLLCVLLAGWTTANPTIYRAGLALQIITPNWPRWLITLVAGGITTIVACFPAIFMRLLDFVAIYGLMLMPIGAVIFTEHWLFPRLGLRQYWTRARGRNINGPALVSWLAVMVLAFPIEAFIDDAKSPMEMLGVDLFFRWLPGWFIAVGLYILLCRMWPDTAKGLPPAKDEDRRYRETPAAHREKPAVPASKAADASPSPLMWVAGGAALFSLVLILYLAIRVFLGGSEPLAYATNLSAFKRGLVIVTVVYFIAAIYWETRREKGREGT